MREPSGERIVALDRVQRDPVLSKRRIAETALGLFARHGVDATGMRAIAEAVGMREASLYHHFASKDALVDAVVDLVGTRPAEAVRSIPAERSMEMALTEAGRAVFGAFASNHGKSVLQVLLVEGQHHGVRADSYLTRIADPVALAIADLIVDRLPTAARQRIHALYVAKAFTGALVAFVVNEELMRSRGRDAPDREDYLAKTVPVFAAGIESVATR